MWQSQEKRRKPGLRVFAFGFQRTAPSSVPRKLTASLVLELLWTRVRPWQPKGRCHRGGDGPAGFSRWFQPTPEMGQIESSTAPKLCLASAWRSLFSCYPSPPFQINHALRSDSTSPPLQNRPTISRDRVPASPPLEICLPPIPAPEPSAGVASATAATAWWVWPRRNRRPSARPRWRPPD